MKTTTKLLLSIMLLGSTLIASAQKKPTREYVADIPPGRNILIQPIFNDISPVKGKLIIVFTLDKKGNVVSAVASSKGTIKDPAFVTKCAAAVKSAKFSELKTAPETQTGSLTYTFM